MEHLFQYQHKTFATGSLSLSTLSTSKQQLLFLLMGPDWPAFLNKAADSLLSILHVDIVDHNTATLPVTMRKVVW